MTASSISDAIQNALVALAVNRSFPVVTYAVQAVGGAKSTSQLTTVTPATVIAWQETQLFDEPRLRRRDGRQRERQGATWNLVLQFDRNVSLDEFETDVLASTPVVSRNPSAGVPHQIDLLLTDADYQNPMTQQPAQGSRVTYRFTAVPTPN